MTEGSPLSSDTDQVAVVIARSHFVFTDAAVETATTVAPTTVSVEMHDRLVTVVVDGEVKQPMWTAAPATEAIVVCNDDIINNIDIPQKTNHNNADDQCKGDDDLWHNNRGKSRCYYIHFYVETQLVAVNLERSVINTNIELGANKWCNRRKKI